MNSSMKILITIALHCNALIKDEACFLNSFLTFLVKGMEEPPGADAQLQVAPNIYAVQSDADLFGVRCSVEHQVALMRW